MIVERVVSNIKKLNKKQQTMAKKVAIVVGSLVVLGASLYVIGQKVGFFSSASYSCRSSCMKDSVQNCQATCYQYQKSGIHIDVTGCKKSCKADSAKECRDSCRTPWNN